MPPSPACSVCGEERGAPGKADRAAVVGRLLDFPRLLELCALYCPASASASSNGSGGSSASGGSQLGQVLAGALQLLPRLGAQAAAAAPLIAQNLGQVAEACLAAAAAAAREADMAQSLQGKTRPGLGHTHAWASAVLPAAVLAPCLPADQPQRRQFACCRRSPRHTS